MTPRDDEWGDLGALLAEPVAEDDEWGDLASMLGGIAMDPGLPGEVGEDVAPALPEQGQRLPMHAGQRVARGAAGTVGGLAAAGVGLTHGLRERGQEMQAATEALTAGEDVDLERIQAEVGEDPVALGKRLQAVSGAPEAYLREKGVIAAPLLPYEGTIEDTVWEALGSSVAFVAGGLLTGGSWPAMSAMGAGIQGQQGYQDTILALEGEIAAGRMSREEAGGRAVIGATLNGLAGSLEGFGIGRVPGRLMATLRGEAGKEVSRTLGERILRTWGKEGGEEFFTEYVQSATSALADEGLTKEDGDLWRRFVKGQPEFLESASSGLVAAGGVSVPTTVVQGVRPGKPPTRTEAEPAPEAPKPITGYEVEETPEGSVLTEKGKPIGKPYESRSEALKAAGQLQESAERSALKEQMLDRFQARNEVELEEVYASGDPQLEWIEGYAKERGVEVLFASPTREDAKMRSSGMSVPGGIVIDPSAGPVQARMAVLRHELYHELKRESGDTHEGVAELIRTLDPEGYAAQFEAVPADARERGEEAISQYVEDLGGWLDLWQARGADEVRAAMQANPGAFRKVLDAIARALQRVGIKLLSTAQQAQLRRAHRILANTEQAQKLTPEAAWALTQRIGEGLDALRAEPQTADAAAPPAVPSAGAPVEGAASQQAAPTPAQEDVGAAVPVFESEFAGRDVARLPEGVEQEDLTVSAGSTIAFRKRDGTRTQGVVEYGWTNRHGVKGYAVRTAEGTIEEVSTPVKGPPAPKPKKTTGKQRYEARLNKAMTGAQGAQRFIQAAGGLKWTADFDRHTRREGGDRPPPGFSPLVYAKGSKKGLSSDAMIEAMLGAGFWPGQTLGDLSLVDLENAIDDDAVPPGAVERFAEARGPALKPEHEGELHMYVSDSLEQWRSAVEVKAKPLRVLRAATDELGRVWRLAGSPEALAGTDKIRMDDALAATQTGGYERWKAGEGEAAAVQHIAASAARYMLSAGMVEVPTLSSADIRSRFRPDPTAADIGRRLGFTPDSERFAPAFRVGRPGSAPFAKWLEGAKTKRSSGAPIDLYYGSRNPLLTRLLETEVPGGGRGVVWMAEDKGVAERLLRWEPSYDDQVKVGHARKLLADTREDRQRREDILERFITGEFDQDTWQRLDDALLSEVPELHQVPAAVDYLHQAARSVKEGGEIHHGFASITDPHEVDLGGAEFTPGAMAEAIDKARAKGSDGIKVTGAKGVNGALWAVFKPEQARQAEDDVDEKFAERRVEIVLKADKREEFRRHIASLASSNFAAAYGEVAPQEVASKAEELLSAAWVEVGRPSKLERLSELDDILLDDKERAQVAWRASEDGSPEEFAAKVSIVASDAARDALYLDLFEVVPTAEGLRSGFLPDETAADRGRRLGFDERFAERRDDDPIRPAEEDDLFGKTERKHKGIRGKKAPGKDTQSKLFYGEKDLPGQTSFEDLEEPGEERQDELFAARRDPRGGPVLHGAQDEWFLNLIRTQVSDAGLGESVPPSRVIQGALRAIRDAWLKRGSPDMSEVMRDALDDDMSRAWDSAWQRVTRYSAEHLAASQAPRGSVGVAAFDEAARLRDAARLEQVEALAARQMLADKRVTFVPPSRSLIRGGFAPDADVNRDVKGGFMPDFAERRGDRFGPGPFSRLDEARFRATQGEDSLSPDPSAKLAVRQENLPGFTDPAPLDTIFRDWLGQRQVSEEWAEKEAARNERELGKAVPRRTVGAVLKESASDKPNKRRMRELDQAMHLYIDLGQRAELEFEAHRADLSIGQKRIYDLSQNLPANVQALADRIQAENLERGVMLREAEVIANVVENYTARLWEQEGEKGPPGFGKFTTGTSRSKQRTLDSILHGWALGMKLRIPGAIGAQLMARKQTAQVLHDRNLLETGKNAGVFSTVAQDGWKLVEHPNFTTWRVAGQMELDELGDSKTWGRNLLLGEGGEVYRREPMYAPDRLATSLNRALMPSKLKGGRIADALTSFNVHAKATILFTNMFHHQAYLRSYWFGTPSDGVSLNSPKAYREGQKAIEAWGPELQELVSAGLTVGQQRDLEEDVIREKTAIGRVIDKVPMAKQAKNAILALRDQQIDFLFHRMGPNLKVMSALAEYRHLLKKHKQKLTLGKTTRQELAEVAASMANDDFGGLNLARMRRDPTKQHVLRLLLLAPDWTESNVRSMVKAFKGGIEGQAYRRMWVRVLVRAGGATILFNALMAGLDDDEDFLSIQKKSWKEGKLRWLETDITPIYKALGGKERKRKYFSVLGHFRDPLKFLLNPGRSIKHKSSVLASLAEEALSGTDWAGREFTTVGELLGIDDKGTYKTSRKGHYRAGDPKGGKLRGQTVSWRSDAYGPVEPSTLPSYTIAQAEGLLPIQMQNLVAWLAGEIDGFDAITKSLGLMTSTTRPEKDE